MGHGTISMPGTSLAVTNKNGITGGMMTIMKLTIIKLEIDMIGGTVETDGRTMTIIIGETILLTTSGGVMREDQMDLCLLGDFKMITLTCGETD